MHIEKIQSVSQVQWVYIDDNLIVLLMSQLFINNQFVDAANGKTFSVLDPCTGEVISNVSEASAVSEQSFGFILSPMSL